MSKLLIKLIVSTLIINLAYAAAHDPTKPPLGFAPLTNKARIKIKNYNLQSIIIGKTRRLALINGRFVTIGDLIDGAQLKSIKANSVTLVIAGSPVTIYLFNRNKWN